MRHFLYLNKDIVDDYYSEVMGFVPEEQNVTSSNASGFNASANAHFGVAGLQAGGNKGGSIETSASGIITYPSKFQTIFNHIAKVETEEGRIPYYDYLNENLLDKISRGDYLELDGKSRFSKLAQLGRQAEAFMQLADLATPFLDSGTVNEKKLENIKAITSISKSVQKDKTTMVLECGDIPVVCELDNTFLPADHNKLIGEVTLFCKVRKQIAKGETVSIDEVFKDFKSGLNREQRRNLKLDNPEEFEDIIKGPALLVQAIAVYS